jgi:hypothetical protein
VITLLLLLGRGPQGNAFDVLSRGFLDLRYCVASRLRMMSPEKPTSYFVPGGLV